jgi:heat shock protein HslJ
VIPLAIVALGALGCSAPDPPAEQLEVVPVTTVDEGDEYGGAASAEVSSHIPDATELAGGWLLEDLGGRGVMDIVQTTLVFDGEGRVSGNGGCNRYTGSYTYDDGELTFGPLAGTKMMCPEAVMDQEDRFLEALDAVDRVAVDGPFLLIYAAGDDQPMRFTRMDEGQND